MDIRTTFNPEFQKIQVEVFEKTQFKRFSLIKLHATERLEPYKVCEGVAGVKNLTNNKLSPFANLDSKFSILNGPPSFVFC